MNDTYSFTDLVKNGIDAIPEQFRDEIDNLNFFVEDFANREQLRKVNVSSPWNLLGLYEGVPISKRTHYSGQLPDRITIFRRPLEARAETLEQLQNMVSDTVWHEFGHFLGMDEYEVRKMEAERNERRKLEMKQNTKLEKDKIQNLNYTNF